MIGKMVILRSGDFTKRQAIAYSRCIDETYCRAELLGLLESFRLMSDLPADKVLVGLYDLDPSYTVAEFLNSYRKRKAELWALEDRRRGLLAEPAKWAYSEKVLPAIPGCARPAYGWMLQGVSPEMFAEFAEFGDDVKDRRHN